MDLRTEAGSPVPAPGAAEVLEAPRPLPRKRVQRANIALALVVAGTFAVHLSLALRMRVPFIHPDEAGYLGNARYLVDGFGRTGEGYASGYSLLITPGALLSRDPATAYHWALVVNALLAASVPLLAYALARKVVPAAGPIAHVGAATFVVLLPTYAVTPSLAMSENALVPAVLACAYVISIAERSSLRWSAAAALAAYASWITPRGAIIVVAFACACAVATRPWRRLLPGGPAFAVLVVAAAAGRLVNVAIAGTRRVPGAVGEDTAPRHLIASIVHPRLWNDALANLLGWFTVSVVTSFGAVAVGVVVLLAARRTAHGPLTLFAMGALVGTYVFGAVSAVQVPLARLDLLVYARYLDGIAAPVLVVGAASMFSSAPRRLWRHARVVLMGGAALALVVLLFDAIRPPATPDAFFNDSATFGLELYRVMLDSVDPARLLLAGTVTATLVVAIATRSRRAALVVILSALMISSVFAYNWAVFPATDARASQHTLADTMQTLRDAGVDLSCVTVDTEPAVDWWSVQNYRLFFADARYEVVAPGATDCGPVVLSADPNLDTRVPGARPIATEHTIPVTLWLMTTRVPSAVWTSLVSLGLVAPATGTTTSP